MLSCDPLLKRTVTLKGSWRNLDGGEGLKGIPFKRLIHSLCSKMIRQTLKILQHLVQDF